jgi:NADPH-dependent F420 reductase
MRIAIIGTGGMGSGFARGLAGKHELVIGSRDPEKAKALAGEVGGQGADYGQAAAEADLVILAVPYTAVEETVSSLGDLGGTTVLDITNLYVDGAVRPLEKGSAAEVLQERIPGARVVKGWTHIYSSNLNRPQPGGQPASVLIAADDEAAKEAVSTMSRDMGFEPVDIGPLSSAAGLERLTALLGKLGFTGDRALKVLEYAD